MINADAVEHTEPKRKNVICMREAQAMLGFNILMFLRPVS